MNISKNPQMKSKILRPISSQTANQKQKSINKMEILDAGDQNLKNVSQSKLSRTEQVPFRLNSSKKELVKVNPEFNDDFMRQSGQKLTKPQQMFNDDFMRQSNEKFDKNILMQNDEMSKTISKPFSSSKNRNKNVFTSDYESSSLQWQSTQDQAQTPNQQQTSESLDMDKMLFSIESQKELENFDINAIREKLNQMEALKQENLQQLQNYVSQVQINLDQDGNKLVEFPQNFDQIVDDTVNEIYCQKKQSNSELSQIFSSIDASQKSFKNKNKNMAYELEKIKQYDEIIKQREETYKKLCESNSESMNTSFQNDTQQKSDQSFTSIGSQSSKGGAFITGINKSKDIKKVQKQEKILDQEEIVPTKKDYKYYIEKNKKLGFMKVDEAQCDKLDEQDKKRLDELMKQIEQSYLKNSNYKAAHEPNAYEQNPEDIQIIDQKISKVTELIVQIPSDFVPKQSINKRGDKVIQQVVEQKILMETISNINSGLKSLYSPENSNINSKKISDTIEILKKSSIISQFKFHGVDDQINEMIEEFSKKLEEAKNAFKEIPIDDMNQQQNDFAQMKQEIRQSQLNITMFYKQVKNETEKDVQEYLQLEQEKKQKMRNHYAEMLAKLKIEQENINAMYANTVEMEERLNQQIVNELQNHDSHILLNIVIDQNEQQNEKTISPIKSIEDYDREITQKLKALNPSLFEDNFYQNQQQYKYSINDIQNKTEHYIIDQDLEKSIDKDYQQTINDDYKQDIDKINEKLIDEYSQKTIEEQNQWQQNNQIDASILQEFLTDLTYNQNQQNNINNYDNMEDSLEN